MNKGELNIKVKEIIDGKGIKVTKTDSEEIVNAVFEAMGCGLETDGEVAIVGFGTFKAVDRKPRQGRNPRNPEQIIDIPASVTVTLKPGKQLKERVQGRLGK